jgi:hypothetical protein
MLYGKFADEGDNPVNNPSIYNVEAYNMLSITQFTTADNRKCIKILFFFNPVP